MSVVGTGSGSQGGDSGEAPARPGSGFSSSTVRHRRPTRFEGDKLAKLRELDSLLLSRCAQAWDIEQHFTIDESRVKSGSRYCPFIWTMYVSLSHASRPRPTSARDELYVIRVDLTY